MKATLQSRKSVRLDWFKQENVSFHMKYELEWSYSKYSVEDNSTTRTIKSQLVFEGVKQPIPNTAIILFENELPQGYMKTSGSVGNKFSTNQIHDDDIECRDRIMKVEKGAENIEKKPPPPQEAHEIKEIQIHKRKDKIWRKLTLKNLTDKPMKNIKVTYVENKEIRFVECKPAPTRQDQPEYGWDLEIPANGTINLEMIVENFISDTYRIRIQIDRPSRTLNDNMGQFQQQFEK
jgi:hypothetical protein